MLRHRCAAVLYGQKHQSEEAFVTNVQGTVKSLYEISRELPPEMPTDTHRFPTDVSMRVSAALHLALYQALLLTVRPIMLHVSRLILSGNGISDLDLNASSLGRLSRTCAEAARRQLRMLITLRKRQSIRTQCPGLGRVELWLIQLSSNLWLFRL